jgi:hypothetical protein
MRTYVHHANLFVDCQKVYKHFRGADILGKSLICMVYKNKTEPKTIWIKFINKK